MEKEQKLQVQEVINMEKKHILHVKDLRGYYKGSFGTVFGVDGISLDIHKGDIVGIAGESGSGKSTFAELITGTPKPLLHFESGEIIVAGFDIYKTDPEILRVEVKAQIMSYVPQASLESLNPVKKIINFIADVVRERTGKKMDKKELLEFAGTHFERVGLESSVLNKFPHELSGGMKQRAVIAISTMWNPRLLIVDEPTSALDVSSQKRIIKMLYEMKRDGIIETILFVSHDVSTLNQLCNKLAIFYGGKIMEYGNMEDLIDNAFHPYTDLLISSIVSFHPDGKKHERLESIPGALPDLREKVIGCRFYERCPKAMSICNEKEPISYVVSEKGRFVNCWLYKEDEVK